MLGLCQVSLQRGWERQALWKERKGSPCTKSLSFYCTYIRAFCVCDGDADLFLATSFSTRPSSWLTWVHGSAALHLHPCQAAPCHRPPHVAGTHE